MTRLTPSEAGYVYVGCPVCGYVDTVPLESGEVSPWCVHSHRVLWHRHAPSELDWTPMVRVAVTTTPEEKS